MYIFSNYFVVFCEGRQRKWILKKMKTGWRRMSSRSTDVSQTFSSRVLIVTVTLHRTVEHSCDFCDSGVNCLVISPGESSRQVSYCYGHLRFLLTMYVTQDGHSALKVWQILPFFEALETP